MRAWIGALVVLSSGCYLAGYGSAPLEFDSGAEEAGMVPPLDAGSDAAISSMDGGAPDALLDAAPDARDAPDAHDADLPDVIDAAPSDAGEEFDAAELDAAELDAAELDAAEDSALPDLSMDAS